MQPRSDPHAGIRLLRSLALAAVVSGVTLPFAPVALALAAWQQPAPATPAARQIGTVKAVDGATLTLATDAGAKVTVTVTGNARILQLAPGSTDLKSASTATLSDVAVGDRVLVTGVAGASGEQLTAARVILMKSGAIAEKHESEQADWQKRGTGGIVSALDPATDTITVSTGTRKLQVITSSTTRFRRYAGDSVKFEDAKPGILAQIQVGDQLRVRGGRSQTDAGATVQAEEIVSGSFKNLSGTLVTVDAARITLKDLTTKRLMTVLVTPNSAIHTLPPEAATRFAARQRGAGAPAPGPEGSPTSTAKAASGSIAASASPSAAPPRASGEPSRPAGDPAADTAASRNSGDLAAGGGGRAPGAAGRSAAGDLSQLVARLPEETASVLHPGEAVMIVASSSSPGSDTVTAVTLLTGVEPILAAAPSGGAAMTLSPWSVGGAGAPDAGGGGGAPQ